MSDSTTIDARQGDVSDGGAAASRAYLVVREGARTQVIDIDEGAEILFGRSAEATVRVEDAKASREHARIIRQGDGLKLIELGSRNGTQLNDQTVRGETRRLHSGDVLRIGSVEILVAESAGVTRSGGTRLGAELARVCAAIGSAAILRLTLAPADLVKASAALASAALVEAQSDGDYACLLEDAAAADRVAAAIHRLAPAAVVSIARAPADGTTADELWRRTAAAPRRAEKRPVLAPAPPGVVVGDPAMVQVFELVRKVAAAPTTVLILGETGVGKEVIAAQLHQQSRRAPGPFMRLNCASLPESLLASELFGHEKGAFTGADRRKQGYIEAAGGGTLFLDEIGELAASMQASLLRVLEDRKFMRVGGREEIACDIRVIAATNRDLAAEVKAGRFREDLYFRLSAFILRVPPLRERPGEIDLLAELFSRQFAKRMDVAPPALAPDALALLRKYRWPGNVRELRNAMEHAVVLAEGGVLAAEHLPDSLRHGAPAAGGAMKEQLADLEQKSIQDALDAEHGNQTRAAKRLGISRRGLLYKMEKYGIKD